MGSFPEMMCGFIGVDVSCQSNIRGLGNWQWRWWGNPHAYISADKGTVTTGLLTFFPPLPRLLSLSTSLTPSHTKGFYVSCLSCPGYTCLPFLFFSHTVWHRAVSYLLQARERRAKAGMPTHSSAVWPWRGSTGAVEELIALFMGFKQLVYLLLPRKFWELYSLIIHSLV